MKLQTGELVNEMSITEEGGSAFRDPLFVILETTPKPHQK
jgi:hypothetical protein